MMKFLDLTLPTPAENLALDEVLLDCADQQGGPDVLRLWESVNPFVTLGYANRFKEEVSLDQCAAFGVPILRRCSGGGTVLQGPGSLSYAVVLRIESEASLESITGTNRYVMEKNRQAISSLLKRQVTVEGFTDLALDGLKFSGNAQRRKRNHLLFHGTFLLEHANLDLIESCLLSPPREPAYRRGRAHREFLTRLPLDAEKIKVALRSAWLATEPWPMVQGDKVARLVRERYSRDDWNFRA